MSKKVTSIKDIAELANVSVSTVSRSLQDSPLISAKTKEKVKNIADKHNFSINTNARNLRLQKTNTVAVILNAADEVSGEFSEQPYVSSLLSNLCDNLSHKGLDMMVSSQRSISQCWNEYFMKSRRADGIIVIGQGKDTSIFSRLSKLDTPFVVSGAFDNQQSYCVIGCDSKKGGFLATSHLIEESKRKKILYLGPTDNFECIQRIEGYHQALEQHNIARSEDMVIHCQLSIESAREKLAKAMQETELEFDGIFACSDEVAIGAMQYLQNRGLNIPNDIAIVGFDNIPAASYITPTLTTISQQKQQIAELLVDSLQKLISGEKAESVEIPVKLIVRSSSAAN